MSITIKNSVSLGKLGPEISVAINRELGAIGADLTAKIQRDTSGGRDINGQAFAPYSEDYAGRRLETSRQVSPPNLNFSGRMLASMRYESKLVDGGRTLLRIFFGSPDEANKARQNLKTRRFFGMSAETVTSIKARINRTVKSAIAKR